MVEAALHHMPRPLRRCAGEEDRIQLCGVAEIRWRPTRHASAGLIIGEDYTGYTIPSSEFARRCLAQAGVGYRPGNGVEEPAEHNTVRSLLMTNTSPTRPGYDMDPRNRSTPPWMTWLIGLIAAIAIVVALFFLFGGDADVDAEGGDIDVDAPAVDADVDAPEVDAEAPDVDVDVESGDLDIEEGEAEADAGEGG